MKKVFLVCALVCASQLYGMEKEEAVAIYMSPFMLPEIKQKILNAALASSKNVDEAIDAIKKFSVMHQVPFDNNFQNFIKFVNLLSKRFPELTKSEIAEKLNPSLAKEYDALNKRLFRWGYFFEDVPLVLNQGADINYQSKGETPLSLAVFNLNVNHVKFLLEHGANPFIEFKSMGKKGETVLDKVNKYIRDLNILSVSYAQNPTIVDNFNRAEEIKKLLEQAMQK